MRSFIKNNLNRFITELSSFIRFPSVSAESKNKNDVKECARWLAKHLAHTGMQHVQLIPTKKHPLVYADWLHAPGKPTLLIYGHYDVQPVDPLNEWHDDPFSGIVKDNYIFGRGASDDKGQLFVHVKAIEYYLKNFGKLPVNIKCIFEGEEEIGSDSLLQFLNEHASLLKADVAVVSDMKIPSPLQPAITYSLRGVLSVELTVKGQQQDLHSGNFGGAIYNPVQGLCEMISKLHDGNGKIIIPGFYDRVLQRSPNEIAYMREHGTQNNQVLKDAGAFHSWGEKGFSLYERITIRPSLSVNGISGGYHGEGVKAIIPSKACAKLSFRLVPHQDPDKIYELFKKFIHTVCPPALNFSIKKMATAQPVLTDTNNRFIKLASIAYERAFNKKALFIASGGTIPVVAALQQKLGIPVVLMGFALANDNLHGPNERFYIPNFCNGIKTSISFMQLLAE